MIGGSSLAGAGALSILVLSFVAGIGWTDTEKVCPLPSAHDIDQGVLYHRSPRNQRCRQ